jgi:hypothetical protein
MSLPVKAIDRLFQRLLSTYGMEFQNKWGAMKLGDVKGAWAHELAGFANEQGLSRIAWALENLPDFPPNAVVFKNLCRQAPSVDLTKALPAPPPPADPARIAAEMAKLGNVRERVTGSASSGRQWAVQLQDRIGRGYKPTRSQAEMVAVALRTAGGGTNAVECI